MLIISEADVARLHAVQFGGAWHDVQEPRLIDIHTLAFDHRGLAVGIVETRVHCDAITAVRLRQ